MKRKAFRRVSAYMCTLLATLSLVSCGDNSTISSENPTSDIDSGKRDQQQFVKSVKVLTQPTKTEYLIGESIDLKGLTFEAVWVIEGEETTMEMNYQDLDSYDKVMKDGMTSCKCTIGGYTFEIALHLLDVSKNYEKINIARIDGSSSKNITKDSTFFDIYTINAVGKDGTADKLLTEEDVTFEVKVGDEAYKATTASDIFKTVGDISFKINYVTLSTEFTGYKVINGYTVYGKDMIFTSEIKDTDKNFLERDDSKEGTNRARLVITDAGQTYAGEIGKGVVLKFHVYSDISRNANMILYASSTIRLDWAGKSEGTTTNQWKPTEMGAQQFNEIFTASYGNPAVDITIGDDVILPGCESKITKAEDCPTSFKTPDDKGRYYDNAIWVNWQAVQFGTIPLKAGDNIITLTNIKGNVANVYALEAQFAE